MYHNGFRNYLLLIFFGFFVNEGTQSNSADIEDYFWRDYTGGRAPTGAVFGGLENGAQSFLGQALFDNVYVPAKIIQAESRAVFEWGGQAYSKTENLKILCTNYIGRFYWYNTSSTGFPDLDKYWVVAGRERKNATLYFARTELGNDTVAGKLLVDHQIILHVVHKGKTVRASTFEVLHVLPRTDPPMTLTTPAPVVPKCTCKKKMEVDFYQC